VPDVGPHLFEVQAAVEQLPRGVLQPAQVQVEAAGSTVSYLHGGEVAVVDQGQVLQVVGGCRPPVDLDADRYGAHGRHGIDAGARSGKVTSP